MTKSKGCCLFQADFFFFFFPGGDEDISHCSHLELQ